uniref:site-specific integrase n=1 Tax=Brucella pseudintermedia TaxID=370111 RepID=UPI0039A495A2
MTAAPFIIDEPDRSDQGERLRLSQGEMIRLLTAARSRPHVLVFCMIGLNTLARPDAILDLSPFQVDIDARLIALNPRGRRQTKKYRPTLPITDTLLPFVRVRDVERFVNWHGQPMKSIKKAFAATVKDAGLPKEVTPYCLRHTMATELRRRGVSLWEVEGFLGHRIGSRVTETYAKFGPDHLLAGVQAIDAYFTDLRAKLDGNAPWSNINCVPLACQLPDETSRKSLIRMVGVTGIEPVTPTMST